MHCIVDNILRWMVIVKVLANLNLSYSTVPLAWYRRRVTKLIFSVSVLLAIAGGVSCSTGWGAGVSDWARSIYLQYRCEHYSTSPGNVVYTTDQTATARLLALGGGYHAGDFGIGAFFTPQEWVKIQGHGVAPSPLDGIVLLHRRTMPSGGNRLLAVHISLYGLERTYRLLAGGDVPVPLSLARLYITAEVFRRQGSTRLSVSTTRTTLLVSLDKPFFMFAGQPDPTAPSKFDLHYTVAGQSGSIEGQLCNDESVVFKSLSGPLKLEGFPYAISW